jgi:hypothetical protein
MNAKMNLLALALLGLAGYAGSAVAGCPSSPVPPWSGVANTQGTVTIVAGGLDASACKMEAQFSAGASGFASATVRDDTPANEPRYRARFLINADGIINLGSFSAVQVETSNAAAAYPPANGFLYAFRLTMSGAAGGAKNLNIIAANEGQPNNVTLTSAPLTAGTNSVEIDWQVASTPGGSDGSLTYWINNNVEGTPTGSLTGLSNSGWVGVDSTYLGLAAPNSLFTANNTAMPADFDTFDSRRQTFIGQ